VIYDGNFINISTKELGMINLNTMSNIHKIAFANAILQECMETSKELPSINPKKSKMSASPLIENLKRIITKESRSLIKRNHPGSQHYGMGLHSE
jgi:hypothetical protein